jgi:hypothetical protein
VLKIQKKQWWVLQAVDSFFNFFSIFLSVSNDSFKKKLYLSAGQIFIFQFVVMISKLGNFEEMISTAL